MAEEDFFRFCGLSHTDLVARIIRYVEEAQTHENERIAVIWSRLLAWLQEDEFRGVPDTAEEVEQARRDGYPFGRTVLREIHNW